jgi:hypothetical protein
MAREQYNTDIYTVYIICSIYLITRDIISMLHNAKSAGPYFFHGWDLSMEKIPEQELLGIMHSFVISETGGEWIIVLVIVNILKKWQEWKDIHNKKCPDYYGDATTLELLPYLQVVRAITNNFM